MAGFNPLLLVTANVTLKAAWSSVKDENLATPSTAVMVSVPPKLVPEGPLSVTLPSMFLSTVPELSLAVTVRPKPLPAATLPGGGVVTTSCVATPGDVALTGEVVTEVRPEAVALRV